MFGDQRARDIVAVARALLDCAAWRHPVAVAIKQHSGEQAWLPTGSARVAAGGVAGKLRLNRIPEWLIDDRHVFAGMGLSLVNDFAAIDAVPQHQVKGTAREWIAAPQALRAIPPSSGSTAVPRAAGIGASSSLRRVPANVPSRNPQRPLSLNGGNLSSCP
jgi:hypothetical protein